MEEMFALFCIIVERWLGARSWIPQVMGLAGKTKPLSTYISSPSPFFLPSSFFCP